MLNEKPRWFPLQQNHSPHGERFRVPWWIAEKAYAVYSARYGTSQSLETLTARGGFGLGELIFLLGGKRAMNLLSIFQTIAGSI